MSRTMLFRLLPQEPPRIQAALFASPEPRTEPPCDHQAFARDRQTTIAGGVEELCGGCARTLETEPRPGN